MLAGGRGGGDTASLRLGAGPPGSTIDPIGSLWSFVFPGSVRRCTPSCSSARLIDRWLIANQTEPQRFSISQSITEVDRSRSFSLLNKATFGGNRASELQFLSPFSFVFMCWVSLRSFSNLSFGKCAAVTEIHQVDPPASKLITLLDFCLFKETFCGRCSIEKWNAKLSYFCDTHSRPMNISHINSNIDPINLKRYHPTRVYIWNRQKTLLLILISSLCQLVNICEFYLD